MIPVIAAMRSLFYVPDKNDFVNLPEHVAFSELRLFILSVEGAHADIPVASCRVTTGLVGVRR